MKSANCVQTDLGVSDAEQYTWTGEEGLGNRCFIIEAQGNNYRF